MLSTLNTARPMDVGVQKLDTSGKILVSHYQSRLEGTIYFLSELHCSFLEEVGVPRLHYKAM